MKKVFKKISRQQQKQENRPPPPPIHAGVIFLLLLTSADFFLQYKLFSFTLLQKKASENKWCLLKSSAACECLHQGLILAYRHPLGAV